MEKAQAHYKRNFEDQLHRQFYDIVEGDSAFHRRDETPNPSERSHKLLPVECVTLPVTMVNERTGVFIIDDYFEDVS